MQTTLYIDGFNLYYGALKATPYKWLDVAKLFTELVSVHSPQSHIRKIKYFTAPVKGKIATHGQRSFQSQNDYHRALRTLYPEQVEIIEGYFSLERGLLPAYVNPLDKSNKVKVWKLEEKQTDVNIAMHLYDDVVRGQCEQVILVSNDSDLVPALAFSKNFKPELVIGAVMPKLHTDNGEKRPANAKLSAIADWTRHYLLETELQAAQLPDVVPTRRKAIFKPDYW